MENERELGIGESFITVTLVVVTFLLVMSALTGCGSSTGWRVSFGVAPVSQIHDIASLQGNQEETHKINRKVAKAQAEDY